MSARKDLIESIESALNFNKEGAEKFFDKVMLAIKEEIIPKDQTFQEFFCLDEQPQLIQGYTAEQWQEIIDGGYLCEFSTSESFNSSQTRAGIPYKCEGSYEIPVGLVGYGHYRFCRPAQIKGVMRPIFVEPVDKEAWCHFFFDKDRIDYGTWAERVTLSVNSCVTKYIEL